MTDLRRHNYTSLFQRDIGASAVRPVSVETVSHAARRLLGQRVMSDILVLESADAVSAFLEDIQGLVSHVRDTNPQYEGDALQAAMTYLNARQSARVALLWSHADREGQRQLIGLVPYEEARFRFGLPVRSLSLWTHIHSFIATPLLREGHEKQALGLFMAYADKRGAGFVRLPLFEAEGAVDAALIKLAEDQGRILVESERHERAFLKSTAASGEAYLAASMRKKKRKEFNRLWNRLSELGDVQFTITNGGDDISETIDRFLRLEAKGWKGKRGTALRVRPDEKRYFETICKAAYRDGKFHCTELTLDGEPIAMLASFIAGRGLYTFKIGFDESYGRYSPGALLMMKMIDGCLKDERIDWVDSCAIPNHPMIDHIWAERRAMRSVLVGTSHKASPLFVQYACLMMRLGDRLRHMARNLYNRMRKEIEHG